MAGATGSGKSVSLNAIITGLLWSHAVHGRYWTASPKEWSAVAAWALYVVLILARQRTGWGGRRAALLGIAAFGAVIFTFVWMNVLAVPVSVSYVAVELARKIFGHLRDKNVLLVGAGKMSELAARHLVRSGGRATVLGGRTFARATELAAALGGRAMPFESLRDELARADIVISGTGAPGIVIQEAESLCAIDVNTGKFTGKESQEETVTQTNIEAADEVAFFLSVALARDEKPGYAARGHVVNVSDRFRKSA